MKKLIVVLAALIICTAMTGCSGFKEVTRVTSHTHWAMNDESGYMDSEYIVIDGEWIEISSHSYE